MVIFNFTLKPAERYLLHAFAFEEIVREAEFNGTDGIQRLEVFFI